MNKTTLLYDTHQNFLKIGLGILPMNDLEEIVSPDYMGFGTTEDERMFSLADLRNLIQRQNEQSAGFDLQWKIQNIYTRISPHGMSGFGADDIIGTMKIGDEETQIQLRFSCMYEFLDNKWMMVHFHGSKPEFVETATDTFGIEEWKRKTEALEKIVAERTAEIVRQKEALEHAFLVLKSTQAQLIQSEKLASLGELTAGIAHEIQNPLNFVNNFSELSVELAKELKGERLKVKEERDEELENELVDDLIQNQEKINLHDKRASSIVKGMLEHSRMSSGVKEWTDMNQLAEEYLRLAYSGIRAKASGFEATVETHLDSDIPQIEVIPQDIGRVLLNLINNAFWAAKAVKKPVVTVTTSRTENQIVIKVSDNGIGMSEATKAKIFQPFFTTKPTGEGTGLGLSLAYDIVTKGHGGTIEVESTEGEGTTFIVKLPM